MPISPNEFSHRAADIRLLLFDVDGVLTDGSVNVDAHGQDLQRFHIRDGAALAWAARAGFLTGVLSGRTLHNDVWVWNGSSWHQTTAAAPWSARDWVATCRYDDALWALTGASPGNAGGAYRSTDLGRSWSLVSEAPWAGSHADALCADGPRGIVIASGNGHGTDVYTLETA